MSKSSHAHDDQGGWTASFAFWLFLLISVALFASVSLAPKLLTYVQLRHQVFENQVELVAMEQSVQYLAKIEHALLNDPEFAQELARADFNAENSADEVIPVTPELSLSVRSEKQPVPAAGKPAHSLPWYTALLQKISQQGNVKSWLLTCAAVMTIFAFTFLHETDGGSEVTEKPKKRSRKAAAR